MTFSVIMPVYGVEKYLSIAIECVLAQTFMDFELILVDDCSPDNCPRICDMYAKRDARVQVIHKPQNEGLGEARNTGLAAANGKFVLFMDSDDFVSCDLLKKAYAAVGTADIVTFGFVSQYENKEGVTTWAEAVTPPAVHARGAAEIGQAFVDLSRARVFPYAWNKVYRREFLLRTNVKFERTRLIEDFLFNIAVFAQASEVICIPNTMYFYRHPAHQTLATMYSPDFFALSKRKYALEKAFLEEMGVDTEPNRQLIMQNFAKHILSAFIRNRSHSARLSFRTQMILIHRTLRDRTTVEMLRAYKPRGVMRVVAFLFKGRWALTCWMMAWVGAVGQKLKTAVKRGF